MREALVILGFLALTIPCSADIIYVKEGGTGSGTSWADAYGDLQDGLSNADPNNDVIWVAEGTYYPTSDYGLGIGDRGKHFRMKNGVAIYGGFGDLGDPNMANRDPNLYETVLSGDIGVAGQTSDNCYHVFYHPDGTGLYSIAILDGFTITSGNADGSYPHNYGGGMYNRSSPSVANCTFTGNSASLDGGGMSNLYSNPTVISCTFSGNPVADDGGGMSNYQSNPTMTGCTFSGNSASDDGGGVYNYYSNPTVSNCIFRDNSATDYGGGMFNEGGSPTVTNCTISNNSAERGGGMYNTGSSPTVTNCILWGNTATYRNEIYGGALVNYSCVQGEWSGTGNIDADPLFIDAAGGDFHLQGTSPCVNAGYNSAASLPAMDFEGDLRIIHGIVDMGVDEVAGDVLFGVNVTIQPFVRAGTVAVEPTEVLYPFGTEVTITADANEGYIFDHWSGSLGGNENPITIIMDSHKYIRAHFAINSDVIYVNDDANGLNNGTTWDDALVDLQEGLDAAYSGDEIWVAEGTHKPSVEVGGTGDRYKSFQMKNGVAIYGGFPNSGDPKMTNLDPNQYETILSGDIGVVDDDSDNCYHVFFHLNADLDANTILDGFTITGGNAGGLNGGGMFNQNSSPTVISCTFSGNSAHRGGGMYNWISSPTVTNCTFTGNSTSSRGGGMHNSHSSPTVTNCKFTNNSAFYGGGMANEYSSNPTMTSCAFTGNSAYFGGGIFNYDNSNPTVTACTFGGNWADSGGGMYNIDFSNPTVTDCNFSGNWALENGGGMLNDYGIPTVTGCTFSGNSADAGSGGGMYNIDYSYLATVYNCTFSDNSAGAWGGGMCNEDVYDLTVTGCTFSENSAGSGGGMYNWHSWTRVVNCTFTGNWTEGWGGGMCNYGGEPTVTNCTFSGNWTDSYGGGMLNYESSPTVTNCIFWGNEACAFDNYDCELCKSNEICNIDGSGTPLISYCDIVGCGGSGGGWDTSLGSDGGGNIDMDPLFIDEAGGDFHLQPNSPCINAGDNSAAYLPAMDFEADPRIIYGIVDMGVDEVAGDILLSLNVAVEPFEHAGTLTIEPLRVLYPFGAEVVITADANEGYIFDRWTGDLTGNDNPSTITMDSHKYVTAHFTVISDVIYVDSNATGLNNGSSWSNAFTDLQDGLAAAISGKEIWVAEGTYTPDPCGPNDPREASFQMINGVAIYGGFPNWGDPNRADRDPNIYETILSGDLLGNDNPDTPVEGLLFDPNRTDNCYHIFYHPEGTNLELNAILDGLTITGGNADGSSLYYRGGGMYNFSSSPTVRSCIFKGNSAYDGGGMYNEESSPTITDCTFSDNSGGVGGGMYNGGGNPKVTSCTFIDNSASSGGGMLNSGYPIVANCTFICNSANKGGGGMYNANHSDPTVIDCTFSGNSAGIEGGGMYNGWYTDLAVTNCLFSGNSAGDEGGGMYNDLFNHPTITGCSFIGNSATSGGGGMFNQHCSPTVTNCIIWGNTASVGNEIYNDTANTLVSCCDLAGCGGSGGGWDTNLGTDGGGNIDADPTFADPNGADGIIGTEDDNLRLLYGSPCIDAGDSNSVPADLADLDGDGDTTEAVPFDIDGLPRLYDDPNTIDTGNGAGPIVDMGAHEFIPCDFEPDGDIDGFDFITFILYWLDTGCGRCGGADLTGEGDVDLADFAEFAELWQAGV